MWCGPYLPYLLAASIGVGTSIPLLLTSTLIVSVFQRSVVSGSSLRRSSGAPAGERRFLEFANTNSSVTPRSFHTFHIGSLRLSICVPGLSLLNTIVLVYSFAP